MKKLAALTSLLASACATVPTPDPVIPARIDEAEAIALYEAYKLVCTDGSCEQNGEANPVRSYERTRLDMPRAVLQSSRRVRNTVSWILIGSGIAGAAGGGLSLVSASDHSDPDAWRTTGFSLLGGAAASILAGILVRQLWPEPTAKFETAYNKNLRIELERRVAGDPTALQARPELSEEEKACMHKYATSTFLWDRTKIRSCVKRRPR
jgi:hypothetical protein